MVPADSVYGEGPFYGLSVAVFSLCPYMVREFSEVSFIRAVIFMRTLYL